MNVARLNIETLLERGAFFLREILRYWNTTADNLR